MLPFPHAFYPLGETTACTEGLWCKTDPRSYAGSTMQSSMGLSKSLHSYKTVFPGWYVLENTLVSCLLPTCYATSDMIAEYKVAREEGFACFILGVLLPCLSSHTSTLCSFCPVSAQKPSYQ